MKKVLVLMLSCCSLMAWAQTEKEEMQHTDKNATKNANDNTVIKPAKTDQNSLDGRSFKITIKEKLTDASTSQYQKNGVPGNQSGVNTGTIDGSTQAQQSAAGHTDVRPQGSVVITDPDNKKPPVTDEQTGGVTDMPADKTATNTMEGNTTLNKSTMDIQEPVADLNNKTITISFTDGMMKQKGTVEKNNAETGVVTSEELFDGCSYSVTSGSGALSTFSSSCTSENTAKAYWNGYISDGTITGNLVVYHAGGQAERYTFTGKATRNDSNRKVTSMK